MRIKKIISVILTAVFALSCFYINSSALTYGDYQYTVTGGSATITSYTGSAENVSIPSSVNGYAVTQIGAQAFNSNKSLKAVSIPSSVKTVSEYAFDGCTELSSVSGLNRIKSIGDFAFYSCALANADLSSAAVVGKWAFKNNRFLEKITLSDSLSAISIGAFAECDSLKEISFGIGVSQIGDYAFADCNSLVSVSFPSNVKTIGNYAFYSCNALSAVVVPSTVTAVGTGVFRDCIALKTMSFNSAYAKVPAYAFAECTSLEKIELGSNIKTIMQNSFYQCYALKSVTLSSAVTEIGEYAFAYSGISSIYIPKSVTVISQNTFDECASLTIFAPNDSFAQQYAVRYYLNFQISAPMENNDFVTDNENISVTDGYIIIKNPKYYTVSAFCDLFDNNLKIFDKYGNKVSDTGAVCNSYTVSILNMSGDAVKTAIIVVKGDVNCDGSVGTKDITNAKRYKAGKQTLTQVQITAACVSGSQKITVKDITLLQRYNSGKVSSFS